MYKPILFVFCCAWICLCPAPVHPETGTLSALNGVTAAPGDTAIIQLNKQHFHPGDTLSFDCLVPGFKRDSSVGTLHVIFEDLRTHRRWRYRYPIINGEAAGDLAVGGGIDDGNYAVNFVVQNRFFRVEGTIRDYKSKDTLTYTVMIRNKPGYIDKVPAGSDGSFRLSPTYIEDTAYFIFSPLKPSKADQLWVDVRTPLDSSFVPTATTTRFISVAQTGDSVTPVRPSDYHFDLTKVSGQGVLQAAIVTGTKKKLVDRFNDEYSTGLFRSNAYMIIDGLESDQLRRSYNVFEFLKWQIPGFTAKQNANGEYTLRWRDRGVTIYLDEFPLMHPNDFYIDPTEVAMIKVYQPPSVLGNRNGVIAIYTKKGQYDVNPRKKNKFKVAGYTPAAAEWN